MKSLSTVSAALAALDFTTENEQIATLESRLAELEAALARADARRTEISRQLVDRRGPDGKAVAEALLADPDVSTAVAAAAGPTTDQLLAERESLAEGSRELRWQAEDVRAEIGRVENQAMQRVRDVAEPLVDEIADHARQAVSFLPVWYACAVALTDATKVGGDSLHRLRQAIDGAFGEGRLATWQRSIPVPGDVAQALRTLASKGPAVRSARFVTSVPIS